jgi:hypothetical protein
VCRHCFLVGKWVRPATEMEDEGSAAAREEEGRPVRMGGSGTGGKASAAAVLGAWVEAEGGSERRRCGRKPHLSAREAVAPPALATLRVF